MVEIPTRIASSTSARDRPNSSATESTGSRLDRLLEPLNRLATRRFLREAREKVWANAIILRQARVQGPDAYKAVLEQLEALSAAKVAALQAPGQVILKLATKGFGVQLPGHAHASAPAD